MKREGLIPTAGRFSVCVIVLCEILQVFLNNIIVTLILNRNEFCMNVFLQLVCYLNGMYLNDIELNFSTSGSFTTDDYFIKPI